MAFLILILMIQSPKKGYLESQGANFEKKEELCLKRTISKPIKVLLGSRQLKGQYERLTDP